MKNIKFILSTLLIILLTTVKSFSLIEVDITRGNLNPLPVAVSPLSIDEKSKKSFENLLKKKNIGEEISLIVENNLRTSGLFNPLNKDAFLQAPDIANLKPRFEDWNLIKAQALITGKVTNIEDKLRVEFRLWDVLAGKEMMALAFTTVPTNWRRVGHIISDKVYERLTGEKGYFDTRIIYVAEDGPKTNRIKKLAIMDQDGENNKFLTLGNELVLTPRFNPITKEAFLQAPDIANLKPRFEDWNLIKAQALITGKVTYVDEKLRVEFRLWDVLAAKEMMALAFTTVPSNWRRVGHIISDKVYERLTGEKGYLIQE